MVTLDKSREVEELIFEFYKENQRDYFLDKTLYEYFDLINPRYNVVKDLDKIFGLSVIEIGHRRERYALIIE